jgi:ABC-type antimicrobial peptide transport system permease subunit
VSVEYFLWNDAEGLETKTAEFRFAGALAMSGLGGDRTLTPEYPGLTDATDISSWDPPFPVELRRVRPKDEDYWDGYRGAPKAFVTIETAQSLWASRFGAVSSIRVPSSAVGAVTGELSTTLGSAFSLQAVRADALAAAEGTTDFGEYFLYFSFFLVVSALLIAYLFFALSVEQRSREVGLLWAVGFTPSQVRHLFAREGAMLAVAGAALGVAGGLAYAQVIMYGLRTWWVGAVGTSALRLSIDPMSLLMGVAGACAAGLIALWWSTSALTRQTPRSLLAGAVEASNVARPSGGSSAIVAIFAALAAVSLVLASSAGLVPATGAFFGAGGLALLAGLAWIRQRVSSFERGGRRTVSFSVPHLAVSHLRWRPRRTMLCSALIALASFLLVSVVAFRKDTGSSDSSRASGTGGYLLMAESVAPLMDNPNTTGGRDELGLDADEPLLRSVSFTRMRLRPGDEASCLTLYRPQNPRILGVDPAALDGRFTFAATAPTPHEPGTPANPWSLLTHRLSGDAIPAIADQTTLTYVLHARVGDDITIAPDGVTPITLRIVGALADSMLQSEIIIGEEQFLRLFPRNEGYRVWLVDAPADRAEAVTALLEDRLSDHGVDVVSTRERLESYHAVENTYLATFQALGALGLLLGTVGVGAVLARNVLERRREWGVLAAVGFTPAHLGRLVLTESAVLVGGGVLLGALPALLAIAPALRERSQALPMVELTGVLVLVAITGVMASIAAVKLATRTTVVAAIKND